MKVVIRKSGWLTLLQRWIKFHTVGLMGMCVQLTMLPLLKSGFGLDYLPATVLAVEAAVLHNFAWHEKFTWKDRASLHYNDVVKRLLRFNLLEAQGKKGQNCVSQLGLLTIPIGGSQFPGCGHTHLVLQFQNYSLGSFLAVGFQ